MGLKFNPLIFSGFDFTGGSSGGPTPVLPAVQSEGDLPGSAVDGQAIVVRDTDHIYVYDSTATKWVDTGLTESAVFGSTPNDVGYDLIVDNSGPIIRNIINLQPADATHPGAVSTSNQTFAGQKSFPNGVNLSAQTADRAAAIDGSQNIVSATTTLTELNYVSGVTSAIQTQLDSKIPLAEKAAPNGVATLDGAGKIPVAQLPNSVMEYKGNWDAATNTPTLADGIGNTGDVYRVSVAGTQNLGSGPITFDVGDYVIYNGTIWEKSDATDAVTSVNGQVGVVVLDTDDINEGATNLYFTQQRARDAVGPFDIYETSFAGTSNVGSPLNVTGFLFPGTVKSFEALVNVQVSATTPLYEHFKLIGVNKGGTWVLYAQSFGDDSDVDFSITSGQIQYISGTYTGFTALDIDFRASTLNT